MFEDMLDFAAADYQYAKEKVSEFGARIHEFLTLESRNQEGRL